MLNTATHDPLLHSGLQSRNGSNGHRYRLPNLQSKLAGNSSLKIPNDEEIQQQSTGSFRLILIICALLLALVGTAFLIATYAGAEIARAGHTIATNIRTVIIGRDVIKTPANMIRYPSQRRAVEAEKLDLYLHWPSMEGYSENRKGEFNNTGNKGNIVFVSLNPRFSTFDMTARIDPIYRKFLVGSETEIGFGLTSRKLDAEAGFIDEVLIVQKNNPYPFSARCVVDSNHKTTPYCIRDIHIGNDLSLTYRFHKSLLREWLSLDRAIRSKFKSMIN